MYGMINKQLRVSIIKKFGEDVWKKVEAKATTGIDYGDFKFEVHRLNW